MIRSTLRRLRKPRKPLQIGIKLNDFSLGSYLLCFVRRTGSFSGMADFSTSRLLAHVMRCQSSGAWHALTVRWSMKCPASPMGPRRREVRDRICGSLCIPGKRRGPKLRRSAILLCGALLAGCTTAIPGAGPPFTTSLFARQVQVSAAQACAIGYDLARAIHERVSLRRVVILAPSRATPCERHALAYLRQSGFRIDETGQGGVSFDIALARLDAGTLTATARIGSDLRISRSYQPVRTGVRPQGPVSVQHLDPDTYNLGRAFSKTRERDNLGRAFSKTRERDNLGRAFSKTRERDNLGRAFGKAPLDWQGQTGPRSRERDSREIAAGRGNPVTMNQNGRL